MDLIHIGSKRQAPPLPFVHLIVNKILNNIKKLKFHYLI